MASTGAAALLGAAGFTDIGAQVIHAAAAHQQRYEQLRWAGLDDHQARAELDNFLAYVQARPLSTEQSWREWRIRRQPVALEPFMRWRPSIFGHAADVAIGRAGYYLVAPCACHPVPFPAGRDYRRRTKHRNRRRRK